MSSDDDADIWPDDVEKAFQDALRIYPAIGRRKLMEGGRMYGRNELIAKHILTVTNKIRTRKQVSSHIQVLGKKARKSEQATNEKNGEGKAPFESSSPTTSNGGHFDSVRTSAEMSPLQTLATNALSISPNYLTMNMVPKLNQDKTLPFAMGSPILLSPRQYDQKQEAMFGRMYQSSPTAMYSNMPSASPVSSSSSLTTTGVADAAKKDSGLRVKMKYFSAYMEHENQTFSGMTQIARHLYVHLSTEYPGTSFLESELDSISLATIKDKFNNLEALYNQGPASVFFVTKFWAHLNSVQTFGLHVVTSKYESRERISIKCTTTVFSFGQPVVEKFQNEAPIAEANGTFAYYFNYSPMCDYMVVFIDRLKQVGNVHQQNKVLANFTVLQVLTDVATNATLFCTAFLFSVTDELSPRTQVYKLTAA